MKKSNTRRQRRILRQSSYLIFHSGTEGTENGNGKRTATKHVRAMLIEEE